MCGDGFDLVGLRELAGLELIVDLAEEIGSDVFGFFGAEWPARRRGCDSFTLGKRWLAWLFF